MDLYNIYYHMGRLKKHLTEEEKIKVKRSRAKKHYWDNKKEQDEKARQRYWKRKNMH